VARAIAIPRGRPKLRDRLHDRRRFLCLASSIRLRPPIGASAWRDDSTQPSSDRGGLRALRPCMRPIRRHSPKYIFDLGFSASHDIENSFQPSTHLLHTRPARCNQGGAEKNGSWTLSLRARLSPRGSGISVELAPAHTSSRGGLQKAGRVHEVGSAGD